MALEGLEKMEGNSRDSGESSGCELGVPLTEVEITVIRAGRKEAVWVTWGLQCLWTRLDSSCRCFWSIGAWSSKGGYWLGLSRSGGGPRGADVI